MHIKEYKKSFLPTAIVYSILISLTLFAFVLGWLGLVDSFVVAILLVSTLIKAQLVIDYFMDLRHVELKWRLIPSLWLVFVIVFIGIAYYLPVQ